MNTLSYMYSNIKYPSRVPLILLTVEKIEYENFDFALLLLLPFLSFCLCITQKLYNVQVYELHVHVSVYQTTPLLPEVFLFLLRAASQPRSMSYASKHAPQSLSDTPFCVQLHTELKTKDCIKTFYLSNDCSTIRDIKRYGSTSQSGIERV